MSTEPEVAIYITIPSKGSVDIFIKRRKISPSVISPHASKQIIPLMFILPYQGG